MEMREIVINQEGATSDEKNLAMLHEMEKSFNTGPIIGEARELILHLCKNLYYRDLLLEAMGMDVAKRQKMFAETARIADQRDREIMASRKASR